MEPSPNQHEAANDPEPGYSAVLHRQFPALDVAQLAFLANTGAANTYDIADAVAHVAEESLAAGRPKPGIIEYAVRHVDIPGLAAGLRTTEDAVRRVLRGLVQYEREQAEKAVQHAILQARQKAEVRVQHVDALLNAARGLIAAGGQTDNGPAVGAQTPVFTGPVPARSLHPSIVWPDTLPAHVHTLHNALGHVMINTGAQSAPGSAYVAVPVRDLQILETGVVSLERKINPFPPPYANANANTTATARSVSAEAVPGGQQQQQGHFHCVRHTAPGPHQPGYRYPDGVRHDPRSVPGYGAAYNGRARPGGPSVTPASSTNRNPGQAQVAQTGNGPHIHPVTQDMVHRLMSYNPAAQSFGSTLPLQSTTGIQRPMTAPPQTLNAVTGKPKSNQDPSKASNSSSNTASNDKDTGVAAAHRLTMLGSNLESRRGQVNANVAPVPVLRPNKHTIVHTPGQSPERKKAVLTPVGPQGEGQQSHPATTQQTLLPVAKDLREQNRGRQDMIEKSRGQHPFPTNAYIEEARKRAAEAGTKEKAKSKKMQEEEKSKRTKEMEKKVESELKNTDQEKLRKVEDPRVKRLH